MIGLLLAALAPPERGSAHSPRNKRPGLATRDARHGRLPGIELLAHLGLHASAAHLSASRGVMGCHRSQDQESEPG